MNFPWFVLRCLPKCSFFYRSNHVSQIKYLPTCEINKQKYLSQIIIKKLYHLQMFYTNYHKIYKT